MDLDIKAVTRGVLCARLLSRLQVQLACLVCVGLVGAIVLHVEPSTRSHIGPPGRASTLSAYKSKDGLKSKTENMKPQTRNVGALLSL